MALSYEQQYLLWMNQAFLNKAAMALIDIANDIKWEGDGVSNHANRLTWANSIFGKSNIYALHDEVRAMLPRWMEETNLINNGAMISDADLKDIAIGHLSYFIPSA